MLNGNREQQLRASSCRGSTTNWVRRARNQCIPSICGRTNFEVDIAASLPCDLELLLNADRCMLCACTRQHVRHEGADTRRSTWRCSSNEIAMTTTSSSSSSRSADAAGEEDPPEDLIALWPVWVRECVRQCLDLRMRTVGVDVSVKLIDPL